MTAFNDSTDILWLIGVQCAQISVLFLGVWCVCRWLLRDRPYLAHGLWVLLLIKCVTPPVWSSEVGVFSWMLYQPTERVPVEEPAEPMGTIVDDPQLIREMRERASAVPEAASATRTVSDHAENSGLDGGSRDDHGPRIRWPLIILSIWVGGAIIIFATTLGRFLLYRRRIWKAAIAHDAAWDEFLDALRKRLGVWRRVRLVVTREPVGPAVFGLLRPTIVLPEAVVASRSPSELEPILAHELIHVRRGDLWIGLLQFIAGAVWWFYPPVWTAIRRVSRTSEECCDFEVVNSLPHARRAYADLLLDVLARKQSLRAIPLVPGMTAGDVTFRRMERIMTVRSNPGRWAVCLRWAVLMGVGVVTLPGAGWDGEDEAQQDKIIPVEAAKEIEENRIAVGDEVDDAMITCVYVLTKVYPQFERVGINRKGAQDLLKDLVSSQSFEFPTVDITELRNADGLKEGAQGSDDAHSMLKSAIRFIDGDSMVLRAPRSTHERVSRLLSALARTGLDQFRVKVEQCFIHEPGWGASMNWKPVGQIQSRKITAGRDALNIETKTEPQFQYATIETAQWETMEDEEKFRIDDDWNVHARLLNGESVRVSDVILHPLALPLPSGIRIWTVPTGTQTLIRVESLRNVAEKQNSKRDHGNSPSTRLHLKLISTDLDVVTHEEYKKLQSEGRLPSGDQRYRPHHADEYTVKLTVPIEPGKTVLIMEEERPTRYGPSVLAITVERLPTEVWRRVGTDEFRIEPAE